MLLINDEGWTVVATHFGMSDRQVAVSRGLTVTCGCWQSFEALEIGDPTKGSWATIARSIALASLCVCMLVFTARVDRKRRKRTVPVMQASQYFLIGALALGVADKSHAQLPEPMRATEFDAILETCEVNADGFSAAREAFKKYQDAFESVRVDYAELEKSIQARLESNEWLNSSVAARFSVDLEASAGCGKLAARINRIETDLFSAVRSSIPSGALVGFERSVMARERERLIGERIPTRFRMQVFDHSRVLKGFDASVDDPMIGPILQRYEVALTQLERQLAREAAEAQTRWIESLIAHNPEGPELERTKAIQWRDVSGDLKDVWEQVAALNRSTYLNLRSVLVDPLLTEWTTQFFDGAYPELRPLHAYAVLGWTAAVDEVFGSATPTSAAINDVIVAELYRSQIYAIFDRAMRDIDEARHTTFDMVLWPEAQRALLEEVLARVEALRSRIRSDVAARSTEELADALLRVQKSAIVARLQPRRARMQSASGASVDLNRFRQDAVVLPDEMSKLDLAAFSHLGRLDRQQRALLDSFHEAYISEYSKAADGRRNAVASMHWDPVTQDASEFVAARRQQRLNALTALQEIDSSFLEEAESIVDDAALAALDEIRRSRDRSRIHGFIYRFGDERTIVGAEWGVDLVSIVAANSEELSDPIRLMLSEYGIAADKISRKQLEHIFEVYEAHDWDSITVLASARNISDEIPGLSEREPLEDVLKRLEQVNQEMVSLNRELLVALEDWLSDELKMALRDDYQRAAYPTLFGNKAPIAAALDRSVQLVKDERRGILEGLRQELDETNERIAQRMIEVVAPVAAKTLYSRPGEGRIARSTQLRALLSELHASEAEIQLMLRRLLTNEELASLELPLSERDEPLIITHH